MSKHETLTSDEFLSQTGRGKLHKKQDSGKSKLEDEFLSAWRTVKLADWPDPEPQFKFHPDRKWRLDYAWPAIRLAVEIQGGNFVGGGHNRGARQAGDYEKQNEAARLGWTVLQFGTLQMRHPLEAAQYVVDFLIHRTAGGVT